METGPMEVCRRKTSQSASILDVGCEADSGILALGSGILSADPRKANERWAGMVTQTLNPKPWEAEAGARPP